MGLEIGALNNLSFSSIRGIFKGVLGTVGLRVRPPLEFGDDFGGDDDELSGRCLESINSWIWFS